MNVYRHIFFDLDNTLTRSRTEIDPSHRALLAALAVSKDVIVVSGATALQMAIQLTRELEGTYFKLSQYGNTALDRSGKVLWQEKLSDEQTAAVLGFIAIIKSELKLPVRGENDLIHHRGSQISYSLIGHHEDQDKKYAFDPKSLKRKAIIASHKPETDKLLKIGITVCAGGTTCLDFILAGRHKGYNIRRLIDVLGWDPNQALYVGDEIAPGRNDETVIGVVDTKAVTNPDETFTFVRSLL